MGRTIEITLIDINLPYRGESNGNEDRTTFTFTLTSPSADKSESTTIKSYKRNKAFPDFANKSLDQRIVFKERIEGETQLNIIVNEIDNLNKFETTIVQAFTGAFGKLFDISTGNAITGKATQGITDFLKDKISTDGTVKCLGKALHPIETSTLPDEGRFAIPLTVPKKLTRVISSPAGAITGEEDRVEEVINAGAPNGTVTLKYRLI